MKVVVVHMGGDKKVQVEVSPTDNVKELRGELERVQREAQLCLPSYGYFFILIQIVMDEDISFLWHEVRHGDTVEIFHGSVSGGL